MNLLELILEYSICPMCNVLIRPILHLGPSEDHAIGSTDYTLEFFRYPLVFSKNLEYGGAAKKFSIASTDTIENTTGLNFTSATLRIYCPYSTHYSCSLWAAAPLSSERFSIIYPSIREYIRAGDYEIANSIFGKRSETTIFSRSRRPFLNWSPILKLNRAPARNLWPLHNIAALEEKINKLLLLK